MRREILTIRDVYNICRERKSEGLRVVDAHIGAPSHPPPMPISTALRRIWDVGLDYLPYQGMASVRERVAEYIERFSGRKLEVDRIFLTNGGTHGLTTVLLALKGSEILLPAPGFPPYYYYSDFIEIRFRTYDPLKGIRGVLEALTPKTRAVLINYPNNPTGYYPSSDELVDLWEKLKDRGVLLINDSAYSQIYYEERPELVGDVIIDTFSKVFAVPGLRLGYVYWEALDLERLSRAVYITSTGISEVSQLLLMYLIYACTSDYLESVRYNYKLKRDALVERLSEIGFRFPEPRGAIYLFMTHDKVKDSNELTKSLLSRGDVVVGVVPGENFKADAEWFRISYGKLSREDIDLMTEVLKREVSEL